MKVVGIVGSPRKNGNVDTLVKAALDGAKEAGMETEIFHLAEMELQGCVACMRCKKEGICRFDDDVWKVLSAMRDADAVVLGAPIYYFHLSSQMRTVLDRSFAFLRPDFSTRWNPGKRLILITSQGNADAASFANVHKDLTTIFQHLGGFKIVGDITMTNGNDPDAIKSRPELVEAARQAGAKMVHP